MTPDKCRLKINPAFHGLIPSLSTEEFDQLQTNILADGCREPLVLWDKTIVDGHNRYQICTRHNLPFKTVCKDFPDKNAACLWIIDNAFGRRNLPIISRIELAEKRKRFIQPRQGKRTDLTSGENSPEVLHPRDQLAKQAGVGKDTYRAGKFCLDHADQETLEKLRRNEIAVHRVAKELREKQQREARHTKRKQATKGSKLDHRILVADFRKAAGLVADGSLSLIFTDPPYDRKASKMLPELAEFASRKLADGGSLICYVGQTQLPAALDAFRIHLRYWWTIACVHSGKATVMREYGINACWKPVLWFVKGTRDNNSIMVQDIVSGGQEKDNHDWQQARSEAEYWIDKLCPKDGIVCDPFLGGGTTAVAAQSLHRSWIAFEIDPQTAILASARLA